MIIRTSFGTIISDDRSDDDGETLLSLVLMNPNRERVNQIVTLLVENNGRLVHKKDAAGWSPLLSAIANNNYVASLYLIKRGASLLDTVDMTSIVTGKRAPMTALQVVVEKLISALEAIAVYIEETGGVDIALYNSAVGAIGLFEEAGKRVGQRDYDLIVTPVLRERMNKAYDRFVKARNLIKPATKFTK